MSGDDDAWRDAARGLGLDPADPDVAELFQCSRTPGFAAAELRRRWEGLGKKGRGRKS